MSHRRVRPILAAALAVPLLLAGCSPQQWGTAARVGDTRIPVDRLHAMTRSVVESPLGERIPPGAHAELQTELLIGLVGQQLTALTAQRHGVTVDEAELSSAMREYGSDPQGQAVLEALPPGERESFVRGGVLREKLAQKLQGGASLDQELARVAGEVGVEVNPRYGRYTGQTIEPLISGNLSREPARTAQEEVQPVPQ